MSGPAPPLGVPVAALREERVAVGESLDAAPDRLALLHRVGVQVLAASSLDDLNELALSLVFDCVRAERGALLLRGADGELEPQVLRHRRRGALGPGELRVPRSIVNEVVTGRVGLLTADALHDPRFGKRASVRGASIRSALCAPLWDGEQVLGVVYLDSRIQSYAFTRHDLVLLNGIANLIAIRLKQESLNRQLSRERVVRSNLARYHSPDVVEAILARADDPAHPELGLEEREISVLFADLGSFTRLAEGASASQVAGFLNAYYEVVTRVIFAHGGTVMEYLGDSAMAIFGAPVAHADHAPRAVRAGLELLRRVRAASGEGLLGFPAEVRVAVNSGKVVVGSVGPPDRLKYAAVGDAVNVAARLEGIAEPHSLILGEESFRRLGSGFECEDLGPQPLRGRQASVRAYRIRP